MAIGMKIPEQSVVEIESISAPTAELRVLIDGLNRELSAYYAPEQRHGLDFDAIFQPHIHFFMARMKGIAVGCGGVALFDDFAEIKRMYVREGVRGSGVADAIMAQLAAETLTAGLNLLRLETGMHSAAALRFYRRCGFQSCAAFAPYSSLPPDTIVTSVFLEKQLS